MFGREELEYHIITAEDLYEEKVYLKNQADKVMDVMEDHIKKLEAENEKLKADLKIVKIVFDERG